MQNVTTPQGTTLKKRHQSFGGLQSIYVHESESTQTTMEFAVFEPPAPAGTKMPVLYFLSGLTCTWENCATKGGVQAWAARHGVIVVWPDTSPRGALAADADADDLGQGAGFYLTATKSPWSANYKMDAYVQLELPQLVEPALAQFSGRRGVFGHSMGGHGAISLAVKHPDFYSSVSAFSPVVNPMTVPWGTKAFQEYLGDDQNTWKQYDSCALLAERGLPHPLLVDVGGADPFLETQLTPNLLTQACEAQGVDLTLRLQPGYDHSYYFISTFMPEHIAWHAERLRS